jgi:pyridoxine 4-dehydrogenase
MVDAEVSLRATEIFSNGVAETCAEFGIVIVAHTPPGAGMLTRQIQEPEDIPVNNYHSHFPRFQSDNFQKSLEIFKELKKLAERKGCTLAQLGLAWIKSHNESPRMPLILPVAVARSETLGHENCTSI